MILRPAERHVHSYGRDSNSRLVIFALKTRLF